MSQSLPVLLAIVAGAADTTSFLSLSGLFAAHVTGNLVMLAVTVVLGRPQGMWSKLAAVPVFVLVVWLVSFVVDRLRLRDSHRPLLLAELALLVVALAIAVICGPFADADHPFGFAVGMTLVAAMAIQNAYGPLADGGGPSTAVMTTNTTRLFVDLAALLSRSPPDRQQRAAIRRQTVSLAWRGSGFVLGCAAGALGYATLHDWALAIPAGCLALAVLWLPRAATGV
jgi:uncharacterized membrane protein YoaK (UPF0700 family)